MIFKKREKTVYGKYYSIIFVIKNREKIRDTRHLTQRG